MPLANDNPGLKSERAAPHGLIRKTIIALNLVAGLILWFGYCTDFSWSGTAPDYIYPPMVGIVALVSLTRSDKGSTRRSRCVYMWTCLPSLIGGGLGLVGVLLCSLGSLVGLLFSPLTGMPDWRLIEPIPSPGGTRFAEIYFRSMDDGYAGGRGGVTVRLRYSWLPFSERDILRQSSYPDPGFVRWKGEDALIVIGDRSRPPYEIELGSFSFQLPEFIRPGSFLNPRSSK